ncbi:TRAP transporter substrate-binding protein [Paracandidimonas soli]|uniref:TRAP transporter substrate-binding protein n=1 Tax=Paracandidimonas soli TaxID=1917182 RepID=UPI003341569B
MKKAILTTLSAIALSVGAGAAQGVTLNLGHTLAPDSHYQIAGQQLAEKVAERSNGEMKINLFPQSQLGGEVKMIQAARAGALDMFITAQAPMVNTVREYSLFDVPYLFDDLSQANKVLAGPVGRQFMDMLPKYNLVGLGFLSAMERNVFSSRPINGQPDMKGMKLRVMQSPGYVSAYEALGALPTPMAYGDLYLALQQGVVDGGDTSPDQFVMDKFLEVSKFYNITRVHYLPALLIISKSRWDKLSPEQQKILQESADDALAYARDYYKKSYDGSIARMKAEGVTVVDSDLDTLRESTRGVVQSLLKQIPDGEALYKAVQEAK